METFSASFAGGQETGNTPLTTQVQWRLVTGGGSATLHAGSVVVLPGDSHCGRPATATCRGCHPVTSAG